MRTFVKTVKSEWRPWGVTLLLAIVTVAVFMLPSLGSSFQYDRTRIAQGEWWRLLTSHWTHWNGSHMLWDLLTFLALVLTSIHYSVKQTVSLLFSATLLIPLIIWTLQPELLFYRGLSGLDSALYLFVVLQMLRSAILKQERFSAFVLYSMLFGFSAKVMYELLSHQTLFVQSMGDGITGVPLAHVVGGLLGVIFAIRPSLMISKLTLGRKKARPTNLEPLALAE